MQFQADILDKEVIRPAVHETTALGAASLAGLAAGVWRDREQIRALRAEEARYFPDMDEGERKKKLDGWHRAVQRSLGWEKP